MQHSFIHIYMHHRNFDSFLCMCINVFWLIKDCITVFLSERKSYEMFAFYRCSIYLIMTGMIMFIHIVFFSLVHIWSSFNSIMSDKKIIVILPLLDLVTKTKMYSVVSPPTPMLYVAQFELSFHQQSRKTLR